MDALPSAGRLINHSTLHTFASRKHIELLMAIVAPAHQTWDVKAARFASFKESRTLLPTLLESLPSEGSTTGLTSTRPPVMVQLHYGILRIGVPNKLRA